MFGGKPKIVSTPGADTAAAEEQNWVDDEAQHLTPEAIARTYLYLHRQERSAWTQELDLRPAKVFLPYFRYEGSRLIYSLYRSTSEFE